MTGSDPADFARRVREHPAKPKPRRFYKEVQVQEEPEGFAIALDHRPIRTPALSALRLPNRASAEAIAAEWRAQGDRIDPASMPLTKLANTAIDRVRGHEPRVADEIVAYAGSDLLCYRAASPARLAARQTAEWDPPLGWAVQHLGARLVCVAGIVHHPQSEAAMAAIAEYLRTLDEFRLAAVHNITTLTGSAVLAAALTEGAMTADAAWAAAHVDEDWQIEQWGRDAEADARRAASEREFRAAVRLLELLAS